MKRSEMIELMYDAFLEAIDNEFSHYAAIDAALKAAEEAGMSPPEDPSGNLNYGLYRNNEWEKE